MSERNEWTPKQLAMELWTRGYAVSAHQAVAMVREFEREWRPVAAQLDAESVEFNRQLKNAPNFVNPQDKAAIEVWATRCRREVAEAGERSYRVAMAAQL